MRAFVRLWTQVLPAGPDTAVRTSLDSPQRPTVSVEAIHFPEGYKGTEQAARTLGQSF